ncbi:hypothetical protein RYZ20_14620 [Thioclava sp. A2]|uniref:hypothetical protein n=1 Tax=Thioclava sp. FCG-A2 TaxID=3080562 RepID=UPI002955D339|nr:hypothetical protein [Thioclava sp. A2]MDV7272127.1 hypothetical protein [Thioclava sp. A2]
MMTLFLLLALAGGVLRFVLTVVLRRHFGLVLAVPQVLALALLGLALLPEPLSPLPVSLPLGLMLGLFLPDLLFGRL